MQPLIKLIKKIVRGSALACACIFASASGCASLSIPVAKPKLPAIPQLTRPRTPADDELPKPQTVKLCLTTAAELAQQGHLHEAILLLEKARTLDPAAADYPRLLAPLYDGHGDLAKARTEYEAAIRTHVNDPDLLNDFACFLDRQGDFAAAETHLRSAISQSPTHERARINLGIVLAHQGKQQEAFNTFSGVVGPAAAHSNLGTILAKQGRYAESRVALQNALALKPDIAPARALLQHLDEQFSTAGQVSQPGNPLTLR